MWVGSSQKFRRTSTWSDNPDRERGCASSKCISNLGLGVDLSPLRPSAGLSAYLDRVVRRCLDVYWWDGLITATPSLDYYESASGCADLAWVILRYVELRREGRVARGPKGQQRSENA